MTEGAVLKVLAPEPPKAHTLVIYVFSGSDPEYEHNLRYFIRTAIKVCNYADCCRATYLPVKIDGSLRQSIRASQSCNLHGSVP